MIRRLNITILCSALVAYSTLVSSVLYGRNNNPGYTCEKGGATRYVEVVKEPGFACRVMYTKSSGVSYPWNARNEADYCLPKATSLVKKLDTLGWECHSDEVINSVLSAQIERYSRYIKILGNVGKRCYFYPGEAQLGDLCGDERNEALIVYTCEADADRWNQYLAVFLETETEPLIQEVGGSGYRQVGSFYIDDRRVILKTEDIDSNTEKSATLNPLEETSIQCIYSAASKWKLIEN